MHLPWMNEINVSLTPPDMWWRIALAPTTDHLHKDGYDLSKNVNK